MDIKPDYSKQILAAVLDTTDSGLLVIDGHGRIMLHNATAAALLKCDAAELNQVTVFDLLPEVFTGTADLDDGADITVNPMYRDGRRHDTNAFGPSAEPTPVRVQSAPFQIDGKTHYLVSMRDASRRRRMEDDLLTRQAHLALLLEVTNAVLITVNKDGVIQTFNQNICTVFSRQESDFNNLPVDQLLPDVFFRAKSGSQKQKLHVNSLFTDGERHEITLTTHDNRRFPANVMVRDTTIRGEPGYIIRIRDLTSQKQEQTELLRHQQRLEFLTCVTNATLLVVRPDGTLESHSDQADQMFRYTQAEFEQLRINDLVPEVFEIDTDQEGSNTVVLKKPFADEQLHDTRARRKQRAEFPARVIVKTEQLDGQLVYIVRVRDVSERKQAENELRSRQIRLETILNNAAEGIITFDQHGVIESFNAAAEKLFGYRAQEVIGKTIALLIPPGGSDLGSGYLERFMRSEISRHIGHGGEVEGRHKDGAKFPMALKVSEIDIDGKPIYTALVADISERKALVDHLTYVAEHDGLTGLYNRSYFQEELERVIERARRMEGQHYALFYIDLDQFKYVNDTMGHAAGDRVLIDVAAILKKRVRKSDLLARLGGDEFVVLLYYPGAENITHTAESFRQQLADYTFKHGRGRIDVGCSIGVSVITSDIKSGIEALSQADIACHIAKRAGRNRVHIFQSADEKYLAKMSLDTGWARRIRAAIKDSQFALGCQPIVNTRTGEVESYEVLIRMLGENNELIMPSGFLPSAERFGLAVDIDKWVIANAIDTLAAQRKTMPALRYSINISGQSMADQSVANLILAKLHETKLAPSALTFELTETVAVADLALAESFLRRLQEFGCQTALDDFGTGFSSFAYLKDLPVNRVKIDGYFVKNLAANPVDQAMVRAMNDIAHALGKQTVAEFVEHEETMTILKDIGVDFAQGYHLGRPDVVLPCRAIVEHSAAQGLCGSGRGC